MSEVAQVVLTTTVEDLAGSFKSFEEMVAHFKDKVASIQKLTLSTCWDIGYEANLIKDAAVYGEKTVENFATGLNINVKQLYRYAQFTIEYTKEELTAVMDKKHMGWGVVNKLISIKDKEDRTAFEDRVASEEIKPSELDDRIGVYMSEQAVEETTEGNTTETGGTGSGRRSYIKFLKKATNMLEILKNTLPLALKDLDDLDEIADDTEKYEKVLEFVYSLREMIEEVEPTLTEVKTKAANLA